MQALAYLHSLQQSSIRDQLHFRPSRLKKGTLVNDPDSNHCFSKHVALPLQLTPSQLVFASFASLFCMHLLFWKHRPQPSSAKTPIAQYFAAAADQELSYCCLVTHWVSHQSCVSCYTIAANEGPLVLS
jgi:hypothetical protein